MEFDTVKEALETLISVNDKDLNPKVFKNVEASRLIEEYLLRNQDLISLISPLLHELD